MADCPLRSVWSCLVSLCWLMVAGTAVSAQGLKTENVFLITTDGLRWQEVFTGAEKDLMNKKHGGVVAAKELEDRYWRESPEERREALLPFFWGKIAREGQLFGNRNAGSEAQITNEMKFSYPGYNELLTGYADPLITSNDKVPNRNFTVLEWLHRQPEFDGKVAAFSAWDVVPFIINRERCNFPVMGGWEPLPEEQPNARQQLLNDLIADTTRPHRAEVIDSFLYQAAREHLLRHQPRVMMIGFLETDAWGHAGRYDNLLNSAHAVDTYIERLWNLCQSLDQYRDKTTFIITTDHGRGTGLVDWKNHGKQIERAEEMWMAFLGPDTPPLGERQNCQRVTQNQIAATLAAFLGQHYHVEVNRAAGPIADVLPKQPEK
ncbi:alkaline phosphatase family protein [Planctomicrobium sp. SH664]|uniref:alkaline phosphatase family protein n=1 Tax=Planctomicrobium sp. SH664 TaxID=3448125 RepID=UPI003F5B0880